MIPTKRLASLPSPMLFRWANEKGVNGMPVPAALEKVGWVKICRHPRWPLSWLMRKDG